MTCKALLNAMWIVPVMIFAVVFCLCAVLAHSQGVSPDEPDVSLRDVLKGLGTTWDLLKAGRWLATVSALLSIIMSVFKSSHLGKYLKKIPKRWRIIIPSLAGVLLSLFAKIAVPGFTWTEVVLYGVLTGPGAVYFHTLIVHGLLGKEHADPARTSYPTI